MRLPEVFINGEVELFLKKRCSVREYTNESLSLIELAELLWSASKIPSAGGLYTLNYYTVVNRVTGLEAGIYRYGTDHCIEKVKSGDISECLCDAGLRQECIKNAAVNIVISATPKSVLSRYRLRGYRYIYMEAGHSGQNIHLMSEKLGLGTVMVGAFINDTVKSLLEMPEGETPLYIIPVGRKNLKKRRVI